MKPPPSLGSDAPIARPSLSMPLTLASLDADVLAHIVRWADSPSSISRLDRTARLFYLGAPRSPVEEGLRLRAEAAGRVVGDTLPEGEASRVQLLLWEERRAMACTLCVARGSRASSLARLRPRWARASG